MFKDLFINDLKKLRRSASWSQNVFASVIMGFFMLLSVVYVLFLSIFLSIYWEDVAQFIQLSNFFELGLIYFVAMFILRFFMQSPPDLTMGYYRLLPIRSKSLIIYGLSKGLINIWLFFSLCFFSPYAFMQIVPQYGLLSGICMLLGVIFIEVFLSYLIFLIKRSMVATPKLFRIIVTALLLLLILGAFNIKPLVRFASMAFDATLSHSLWWLTLVVLDVFAWYANYKYIKDNFYFDDKASNSISRVALNNNWLHGERYGMLYEVMNTDLRLMSRNKRFKGPLLGFVVIYAMCFYYFRTDDIAYNSSLFIFFLTNYFSWAYLMYAFSYEASYWDLILISPISLRQYVMAKLSLASLLIFLQLLLSIPFMILFPSVILQVFSMALFGLGFCIPFTLWASSFSKKRYSFSKANKISQKGMGATQLLLMLCVFLLPMLIGIVDNITGKAGISSYILIGVGVLGVLMLPFWIKAIVNNLLKRKYIMASGFREKY